MNKHAIALVGLVAASACTKEPSGRDFPSVSVGSVASDSGESGDVLDTDASESQGSSGEAPELDELSEFVFSLGHLEIADWVPKTETPCEGLDCPVDGPEGEEYCVYVDYEETVHAHEFVAFQPSSATLWPGNVVRGDDAEYGILTPVGVSRAPLTFSLSLENLQGSPVGEMEEPTLSAFRDERNRILAPSLSSFRELRNQILAEGTTGATPAQISYDINSVKSESQLSVMVGADVAWTGVVDLSAMFDFDESELQNKYLFDFTQTYYTADLDAPTHPAGVFDERTTIADMQAYMGEGNPPVHVQSISYGRRVLFGLETNQSMTEIAAALDAAVASVLDVEVGSTDALLGSKITASVIGGDGDAAVKTVLGVEQLLEYITAGGNYSLESPGVPIAYKLAYLDNAAARLALTAEYPEAVCQ